ncbi:MAG TPA: hypothetical protein VKU19_39235 [Bryobacteraceae bacterium]|nr:hypothetical protein [Bryobacteraceae bacterium]
MSKPGIDQLLIRSALERDLCRRVLDTPDEVFAEYDLSEEEKDLLRHPDHRLLPLLGRVLKLRNEGPEHVSQAPPVVTPARNLPDISLAVTVVPCMRIENGALQGYSFAVWVNPLTEGANPAELPAPAGVTLPGRPLAPLHVVIQVSAIEVAGAEGQPQVGLSAYLRQSSNVMARPPVKTSGERSAQVEGAVAAVRSASKTERYERLMDLLQTLRAGVGE